MGLNRLRIAFAALAALLTLLWLLSTPVSQLGGGFWPIRHNLILLTGILALGFMAVAIVLAARPVQIESALGGLDKFYRLHKWLGVSGLTLAVVHWLLEILPRSMVRQGWLERPARPPRAPGGETDLLDSLRHPASGIGEWMLYLLILVVLLALWKRFPYHLFFKTHKLTAPAFLLLVFHGVVLMPRDYWTAPIGPVMALILAAGAIAAAASLFRRIGHRRKAAGAVAWHKAYEHNAVLDVGVQLETAWPGHKAGQFAFLDFDDREGAHPFTISSAWKNDGKLTFTIKGLGDYTRRLPELVRDGLGVTVEGPYGRFDFSRGGERQIWIGGGVGITPFIARMQALLDRPAEGSIDLFYSTSAPDHEFVKHVEELAHRTGVHFHLIRTPPDPPLTLDRLQEIAPDWATGEIWFCGPTGFAAAMRKAMTRRGLSPDCFHQELFEMR